MNFFVTNSIGNQSSGIEHAMIKRLNLFLAHDEGAAIVSTMYYSRFHYDFNINGLEDARSFNMFDYFLGTLNAPFKTNTLEDFLKAEQLPKPKPLGEERSNKDYIVTGYLAQYPDGKQAMIRVDKETNQLDSVAYADASGKLLESDVYDYRGFKSIHFDIDQNTGRMKAQTYLTPDGKKPLKFFYSYHKNQEQMNRVALAWHDEMRIFSNNTGIEQYFFDLLNKEHGENNVFISDRYEVTPAVGAMKTKAHKYVYLHSNFTVDPDDPNDKRLNYNYAYGIRHNNLFDGLIVPTEKEKQQLDDRFHFKHPVYAVPSGYIDADIKKVPISDRKAGQLVAVARIAPEKRLDQIVRAFAIAHKAVPKATLAIVGMYADQASYNSLKQTIIDNDVADSVYYTGYTNQMDQIYNDSVALAWTSRGEGFGLALIEAQSHGVPVIAYDINYGPDEIINDGESGYLVEIGNVEQLAEKMTDLLKDSFLQQKLSNGAYEAAQKYTADNVWQKWQVLLKDVADKQSETKGA
ncbi:glycosyltransferase [Agrilactobacillus fermenti]|uniref:glycosyltransferase n=1 Tax=Agrilactobacillus fermenti TaxID=2586909 RepID=UPI003A5C3792